MKSKEKTGIEPRLRFPEFAEAGDWEELPFEEVYCFKVTNSFSRDMLNYEKGLVKNIHYGDIHTKFSNLFHIKKENVPFINLSVSIEKIKEDCYCIEGDMIFADASEDLADVGKSIELININNERLLSGLHTILARQKLNKIALGFGGHLFKSQGIKKQIQKESQGAKVLGLSAGRLAKIKIYFPSLPEQQKIADCLSSLDELIAATDKRLAALQTHKKGLMQQLFPQAGATVPRLRFPEFAEAGDWEVKVFSDVVNTFKTGKLDANAMVTNGQYRFYTCAKNYYQIDHYAFEGEALLVAGNGAHLGYIHHYIGKFNAYQRTYVLQDFKANVIFLKYILDHYLPARIQIEKKEGNTPYIVMSTLTEMPLVIPRELPEQQKIADCLSSLDELIAATAQRLAALQTHKKGLMQAMFPAPATPTQPPP